jgi:hypothetical protein
MSIAMLVQRTEQIERSQQVQESYREMRLECTGLVNQGHLPVTTYRRYFTVDEARDKRVLIQDGFLFEALQDVLEQGRAIALAKIEEQAQISQQYKVRHSVFNRRTQHDHSN